MANQGIYLRQYVDTLGEMNTYVLTHSLARIVVYSGSRHLDNFLS